MNQINKFPEMCLDAIEIAKNANIPSYQFDKMIICGMGGSAVGGDLLKDLLRDELPLSVEVSKEYHLPAYADEKTLVFAISYSGNTEETLSQFVDAVERKCKIICLSSGGKLREWADRLKIPTIVLPAGFQPRAALPYLFLPLVVCLQKMQLINLEEELKEAIEILGEIRLKDYNELADDLKDSMPVIYSDFGAVARRFKNQLNENSKTQAKADVFPELNHNEMVGYENKKMNRNDSVVILRSGDESQEIKTRIEFTEGLLKDSVKSVNEIWAKGKGRLARMFSLVYIGDYISYKLADLNGVNADEAKSIDMLKKELKEKINLVEKLEKRIGSQSQ